MKFKVGDIVKVLRIFPINNLIGKIICSLSGNRYRIELDIKSSIKFKKYFKIGNKSSISRNIMIKNNLKNNPKVICGVKEKDLELVKNESWNEEYL